MTADWSDDLMKDAVRIPDALRRALTAMRKTRPPESHPTSLVRFAAAVCLARGGSRADGWVVGRGGKLLHYRPKDKDASLVSEWEASWDFLSAALAAEEAYR